MLTRIVEPQRHRGTEEQSEAKTATATIFLKEVATSHALNAQLERRHVKIDEQPQRFFVELEVGEQLRLVNGLQFGNGFQLHYQDACDNKIQAVSAIKTNFFVAQRQRPLSLERNCVS